jgi:glycosyltransferase involved in cell wall biosynthesis
MIMTGTDGARRSDPRFPKIAIFLPALGGGGAERAMVNLANEFTRRRITVELVLNRREGPYLPDLVPEVKVVHLRCRRMIRSLPRLVRYLHRQRPDVLLSALVHGDIVALIARRLARASTRIVISHQNTPSEDGTHTDDWRVRVMPMLMRACYPDADGVVAISRGVADDLAKTIGYPRQRISVINNPAVTPDIPAKAREPLEHPWFAVGGLPVIVGVGRLVKQKDFPTLIQAFDRLRRERQARLIILGEGEKRPELEALVANLALGEHVSLPGFERNPYRFMARSRLFVLSSRWEGFANVVAEALACGTPVVSTDCKSGPGEILGGGRYGRLVPVGDPDAMAAAMLDALQSAADPTQLIQRSAMYSVAGIADQYSMILFPNLRRSEGRSA